MTYIRNDPKTNATNSFSRKGNIIFLPWLWSRSAKNDILKNCFRKRQILKKSISVVFLMPFSFAIFRSNLSTWIVTLLRWEIDVYEKPCRGKHQSAQNKWGHCESFSGKKKVIISQWFIFLPSNQGHDLVESEYVVFYPWCSTCNGVTSDAFHLERSGSPSRHHTLIKK